MARFASEFIFIDQESVARVRRVHEELVDEVGLQQRTAFLDAQNLDKDGLLERVNHGDFFVGTTAVGVEYARLTGVFPGDTVANDPKYGVRSRVFSPDFDMDGANGASQKAIVHAHQLVPRQGILSFCPSGFGEIDVVEAANAVDTAVRNEEIDPNTGISVTAADRIAIPLFRSRMMNRSDKEVWGDEQAQGLNGESGGLMRREFNGYLRRAYDESTRPAAVVVLVSGRPGELPVVEGKDGLSDVSEDPINVRDVKGYFVDL